MTASDRTLLSQKCSIIIYTVSPIEISTDAMCDTSNEFQPLNSHKTILCECWKATTPIQGQCCPCEPVWPFQVSYETPSYSLTIIGSEYLMIPNLILGKELFRTWKISVEPSQKILTLTIQT